jgi:SagB-type dehydrogenase family enzyme
MGRGANIFDIDKGRARPAKLTLNPLLNFIEYDEGLIVEGMGIPETIRGVVAQTILVPMLPLLTEGRSIDELLDSFPGVPETTIRDAVAKMRGWNFIVDTDERAKGTPSIIPFVQRTFLSQGLQITSGTAEAKLKTAKIRILAPRELRHYAEILVSQLQNAMMDAQVIDDLHGTLTASDLAVVLATSDTADLFERAESSRLAHNGNWLRLEINVSRGEFDIGPHFREGNCSCFTCFQTIHCLRPQSAGTELELLSAGAEACIGFAGLEIIAHVAQFPNALIDREFRRFEMNDWTSERLVYSRFPDCSIRTSLTTYGTQEMGHRASLTTASVYEDCISLDTYRPSLSWASEQATAASHSLVSESKGFRDTSHVELNATSLDLNSKVMKALQGKCRKRANPLLLSELGGVLALGAGIRRKNKDNVKRWASTAGNLGSVELYVVAHEVPGLTSGVYFYQPSEHSLARLSQEWRRDTLHLIEALLPRTSRPPELMIVLTGAHHRLAKKYGPFAYKLLHLDAGVAFSQISAVLTCLGIPSQLEFDFDETLMERILDLHFWNEHAVALVTLQANVPNSDRSQTREMKYQEPYPISVSVADEFCRQSPLDIEKTLFKSARASRMSTEIRLLEARRNDGDERAKVRLPRAKSAKMTLSEALDTRKSARGKLSPVSLGMFGDVLRTAYHRDLLDWPNEPRLGLWVVAQQVHPLIPGIYRYHEEDYLTCLTTGLEREKFRNLFVQDEWSAAPCSIWISLGLPFGTFGLGSSAYRKFLFRAGAAAHRLTLGAISQGLQATIVAGVIQGEMRRLLNTHQSSDVFALACVIGGSQD